MQIVDENVPDRPVLWIVIVFWLLHVCVPYVLPYFDTMCVFNTIVLLRTLQRWSTIKPSPNTAAFENVNGAVVLGGLTLLHHPPPLYLKPL